MSLHGRGQGRGNSCNHSEHFLTKITRVTSTHISLAKIRYIALCNKEDAMLNLTVCKEEDRTFAKFLGTVLLKNMS